RRGEMIAVGRGVEGASAGRRYAPLYVRVLDGEGRLVAETPGLGDALPPAAFPPPGAGAEPGRGADVDSAAGRSFRALAVRGGPGVVQGALDRTPAEALLAGHRPGLGLRPLP